MAINHRYPQSLRSRIRTHAILTVSVCAMATPGISAQFSATAMLKATGIRQGLCVYLGDVEGGTAVALSNEGAILVHVLTADAAKAKEVRESAMVAGLPGVISAEVTASLKELPHASELANLVVVDGWEELAKLGLSSAELERILVPDGRLLIREVARGLAKQESTFETLPGPSGWILSKKAAAKGTDGWTHWDHGPDGNALSEDTQVKPPTHLKWSSGNDHWGSMSGPYPGVRLANGTAVYLHPVAKTPKMILTARDAYNGTHKWTRDDVVRFSVGRAGWCPLTLDDKHVYTITDKGGPAVALDLATGKTVVTYTDAAWGTSVDRALIQLVRVGNQLIQFAGKTVTALEPATGKILWRHSVENGRFAMGGVASDEEGKAFFIVVSETSNLTRWPTPHSAIAIIALSLKDGKQVWRSEKVKGYAVGQLNVYRGRLGFFGSGAIGGANVKNGAKPSIGMLQASDGKTLWFNEYGSQGVSPGSSKKMEGYHMAQRGDSAYVNMGSKLTIWNAKTGTFSNWVYKGIAAGNNQRCAKGLLTPEYILTGYVTWIDRNFNYELKGLRRSGCAMPGFPGYGMIYFSPATCACIPELNEGKGYVALGSDGQRKIVSDAWRLTPSTSINWVSGGTTSIRHPLRKGSASAAVTAESPIISDWHENRQQDAADALGKSTSGLSSKTTLVESLEAGPWSLDVHASAMYVDILHNRAFKGRLYTGGRITVQPVVGPDAVYIGAGDGAVYSYSLKTGEPGWKFFAAPYDRRMVVASQLESSWPVTQMSLEAGELRLRAGRHPALEKGLFDYGLDPVTGELKWKRRVFEDGSGRILEEQLVLGEGPELDRELILPESAPQRVRAATEYFDIGGRRIRVLPQTGFLWNHPKRNLAP